MQDKLEKFVRENRKEFDSESPNENLWEKISPRISRIEKKKKFDFSFYLKIAAMLVIGIGLGYYFFPKQNISTTEVADVKLFYPPQFAEMESNFQIALNTQLTQIRNEPILNGDTSYFSAYVNQLKELDDRNEFYKKELLKNGYSENIIQEMIEYYQLKLNVLRKLQKEITKINNRIKNQNNENKPAYLQI